MRKLQLTSRRVLATLMALVLLAVMIPTVLTDKAMAADYVEHNGEYYFWTEGGLRQLLADRPWGGVAHFVRDRESWRYDGTELVFTRDLTIPEDFHVKLGGADVSVADGRTLTVEGTLELDAGNSVQGPGRLVHDNGTYIKTRDVKTLEQMDTALADAAAAKESDGAGGSVSVVGNVAADGDYTLTAGVTLQVESGQVLTVNGTLTVPAGAVLINNGGVDCETMVIAEGGVVYNNSSAELVEHDDAKMSLYYGDRLTIHGTLYNKGLIGCGYRSSTMIEIGAAAVVENENLLGGGLTMDFSVDPAAVIRNTGEIDITFDNRAHMTAGENIQYRMDGSGMVLCVQPVTDAGGTAAMQAAAARLTAADKADYEWFCLLVRNETVGESMNFTLDADLTLSGAGVDVLFIKQYGYNPTGGVFTLASGRTLNVQAGGEVVTVNAAMRIAGTMIVESGTDTAEGGFAVFRGTVQLRGNGLLQNSGYVMAWSSLDIGTGKLLNMAPGYIELRGLTMNHGSTLVNESSMSIFGDACLDGTVDLINSEYFQITGRLTRGSELALAGEENLFYTVAVNTAEEAAEAFAQGHDEVLLKMQGDMLLTEALCVPAGKTLTIGESYTNDNDTLAISGAALTLEPGARMTCNAGLKLMDAAMTVSEGADATIAQPMTIGEGSSVTNNGSLTTAASVKLDGKLTVCSWTHIGGDLRANGTLDITADNASLHIVGSLLRGENFVLLGSENRITYMQQIWDVNQLGEALASGAQQVELLLEEDAVLHEAVTVPAGTALFIMGQNENMPTFTIGEGGSLTLEPGIEGEDYLHPTELYANVPVVTEGALNLRMYSNAYFSQGLTVTDTGRVGNNGQIAVTYGSELTVADGWSDHWVNGESGTLVQQMNLMVADGADVALEVLAAIQSLTVDQRFDWLDLTVNGFGGSCVFGLTEDLTIPAGVHLNFYNDSFVTEVRIEDGVTLTVDGELYSNASVSLNGALTVNSGASVRVGSGLWVGGALTVNEGGYVWCSFLSDTGVDGESHGTIVNNGRLYADGSDIRYNDDPLTPWDYVKEVRTEEALRAALEEGGDVRYRGDLTLTADLVVPANVFLRFQDSTLTVPEGVTLTLESNVNVYGVMQLDGTLVLEETGGLYVRDRFIRGAQGSIVENGGWTHFQYAVQDISQLDEAFAQDDVDTVVLQLSGDYVLTQNVTIPAGGVLRIEPVDGESASFTIDDSAAVTMAAFEQSVGTARLESVVPVTVNGRLNVEDGADAVFESDLTVGSEGCISNNGSISVSGVLTVPEPWDSHMKKSEAGSLIHVTEIELNDRSDDDAVLRDAIQQRDDRFDSYRVDVRVWPDREIVIDGDLTIPADVELRLYNGNIRRVRIASGAFVTVDGSFGMSVPLAVDGALTINGGGNVRVSEELWVGGTLTVNEDGFLWCWFLSDTGVDGESHGTIVSNGRLRADSSDIRYNDDPVTPDSGEKVVRTEEALRAALEKGGDIIYRGDLTLTADLVVPANVYLRIVGGTVTVPEGVTLTNLGQLDMDADLALYGTLRTEDGEYLSGRGVILAGSRNNVSGNRFYWTGVIRKDGDTAVLTVPELETALRSDLLNGVAVLVGEGTQLSLSVASGEVIDSSWVISFEGETGSALIVPEGVEVRYDGWNWNCGLPVIVNGSMTLGDSAVMNDILTVNGTLTVYGELRMYGHDLILGDSGKLYLRENTEGRHGRVVLYCANTECNVILPDGAALSDHVLRDGEACRVEKHYIAEGESGLRQYIQLAQQNSETHYVVKMSNAWDEFTGEALPVQLSGELVIPSNMTLECYSGDVEVLGAMQVYGKLECSSEVRISGTLLMQPGSMAELYADVIVTGALTIQSGAEANINRLSGSGAIVNDGTLRVSRLDVGTVISGSGDSQVDDRSAEVSSPAALAALLEKLSADTAQRYRITLVRDSSSGETFTIGSDMTIPGNVELVNDGNNGFAVIETAQSAALRVAGYLFCDNAALQVDGTLCVMEGAIVQDPVTGQVSREPNGYVGVNALTVGTAGKVENYGIIQTSAAENAVVIDGTLENFSGLYCSSLYHSGANTLKNSGTMQIAGSAVLNAASDGAVVNTGSMMLDGQLELRDGTMANGTMTNGANLTCGSALVNGALTNTGFMEVYGLLSIPNGSVDSTDGTLSYGSCDAPEHVLTDWRIVYSVEALRAAAERAAAGDTLTLVLLDNMELTEDLTIPEGVGLVIRMPSESPKTGVAQYAATGSSASSATSYALVVANGATLTVNDALDIRNVCVLVHGRVVTNYTTDSTGLLLIESDGVWENHNVVRCCGGMNLFGALENYSSVIAWQRETDNGAIISGWIELHEGSQWSLNNGQIGCMSGIDYAVTGYGDGYEMSAPDGEGFCWLQTKAGVRPDGDVDGNGVVDAADLDALVRHVACIEELYDLSGADIDGSGVIDAADITMLAQLLQQMGVLE